MSNSALPLILISGATATGKTDLAIEIVKNLESSGIRSEVINADSLLFYKELSIGTAKPTLEERQGVTHYLVDYCSVQTPLNASDYCDEALTIIEKLHLQETIPILVGGSAFYIRALLKGMYDSNEPENHQVEEAQKEVEQLENKLGWEGLRQKLKEVDEASFNNIHENDRYRTMRALEYYLIHQKPISLQKEKMEQAGPYDFSRLRNPNWHLHHIYLEVPKDAHWSIMEKRAQKMLQNGLLSEVDTLIKSGLDPQLKPLQSIGYKECFDLRDKIGSFDSLSDKQTQELAERIYINTRRLAKSQKTFFKKITPKNSYNPLTDRAKIREDLENFLKELNYG